MKHRNKATLLFLVLAMNVHGQIHHMANVQKTDSISSFVKSYTDSLKSYRLELDSLHQIVEAYNGLTFQADGNYSRLFMPMTFYHDIVNDQFSLEDNPLAHSISNKALEKALLHIYLYRPDLVKNTQSQLDAQGNVSPGQATIIKNKTDIVEKIAPTPFEPVVNPLEVVVKKPNFWRFYGDGYLQFLQNYISNNWYKGGESNYMMLSNITLNANYNNKQKFRWENKLEMKLGFQTSERDTLHSLKTSTDEIRYTGSVGIQASRNWYYSLQLIANTQFLRGYRNNDDQVYSDFTSPLDVTLSFGMDYNVNWFKNKLTGKIHLAPFAYSCRYVGRSALVGQYGIETGKHFKDDYGSEFNINLNWILSDLIRWRTRLYGYTSYKRSLVEWENTFTFQLTKYLTTNLYIYPRFDDSMARNYLHGYFMYKEYLSFGLSYSF